MNKAIAKVYMYHFRYSVKTNQPKKTFAEPVELNNLSNLSIATFSKLNSI